MIAFGTVRRGSMVSSVKVVTASKPRKEYAATAAPPPMATSVESMPVNGAALISPAPPSEANTSARERATKKTMTRI